MAVKKFLFSLMCLFASVAQADTLYWQIDP